MLNPTNLRASDGSERSADTAAETVVQYVSHRRSSAWEPASMEWSRL
ncbi:MAG: hypothetical protein OXH28_06630 [bacterium]|nr:hypothetical protein [bacterium]